jgi:hypothetical protein
MNRIQETLLRRVAQIPPNDFFFENAVEDSISAANDKNANRFSVCEKKSRTITIL